MKEILKRTLKLFSVVTLGFIIITLIIYIRNKGILDEEFGRILVLDNGELVVRATNKMEVNFKFIKYYEYMWAIISTFTPYIYIKLGFIYYIEEKIKGSFVKRIYLRGFLYGVTFFLLYNSLKFIKIIFQIYIRNNILYGKFGTSTVNLLEELSKYNNMSLINFILVAVIIFYYYKTSKKWYLIIWSMFIISNLIGGYLGSKIEDSGDEVYKTNYKIVEAEESLKDRFDLKNVSVKIIKNKVGEANINAYALGYFNNNNVYVLENAVNNLNIDQYRALIAHEYAHCENDDVLKSIIIGGVVDLVGIYIAVQIFKRVKKKRIRGNTEFFKLILIINIVLFLMNPIKLAYSRYQELRADNRAMVALGEGESNLYLQYKLIENTSIPVDIKGVYKWLYYTHPTAVERIENAKGFNN